ncbi:MAG: type I 3-dehydroquinate dehydratase [Candidatus Aminicenantes bacterium]|nr:type I 3-dehydroquinate dehydratase [Candidatus Aminicenantes bacterium]
MICISIADVDFEECSAALQDVEMAEIRLDRLNLSDQQVREIFSLPCRTIATHRPGKISAAEREASLIGAIECGAAYVDIEIEAGDSFKKAVIVTARQKGCKIIFSYHDFEKTPPADELAAIAANCFDGGCDIAKIACLTHSEADSARILSLYDSPAAAQGKILALGMGEKGRITRVAAPLLGAPFTFAALGAGRETAPGQIDQTTLAQIFQMVKP